MILPEFVPAFVFNIKSPVPLVVIVALALLSPTRTVSASNCTSPVPAGVNAMLPLVSVDVIELPSIVILSITAEVNVPAAAEFAPIIAPSIAPPSISTFDISTSPVPSGVIAMLPLDPSAMVITPEFVPLFVFIV